jgi:4-oxalocrotonate tautomerase
MPLARIDMIEGKPAEYRQTVGEVVYRAMVEVLKAPEGDRFQVIAQHAATDFVFDPHFFGIERSPNCIFIQLTLAVGRTIEQKRGQKRLLVISTLGWACVVRTSSSASSQSPWRDWSFGNGEVSRLK